MIAIDDIRSLTDFQRNTKAHLKRLKTTGRPEVLTVNGRAELIVQNAASYQAMLDAVERAEAIAGIQRGLDSADRGEGEPASKAFARIRRKHGIPA